MEAVLHVSDGREALSDGTLYRSAPAPLPHLPDMEIRYTGLYDGLPLWPGASVPQLGHPRDATAPGLWDNRRVPLTPLFGPPKAYATKSRHSVVQDCASLQVAQIVQPADPSPSMLSPDPFDFGDVLVGTGSARKRFTLTNLMPSAIALAQPTTGNAQFHIHAETCSAASLAPGATCTIDATYTPGSVIAPRDYRLEAKFADARHPTVPIAAFARLRGAGVPAGPFSRVEFDRLVCTCPDTAVGSARAAVRFTAGNTGALPAPIAEVGTATGNSADFVLGRNGCPVGATLAPGQRCSVDVSFRTSAAGRRTSALSLKFAADDAAQGYAISDLEGRGIADADAIHADGFEAPECSPWW